LAPKVAVGRLDASQTRSAARGELGKRSEGKILRCHVRVKGASCKLVSGLSDNPIETRLLDGGLEDASDSKLQLLA